MINKKQTITLYTMSWNGYWDKHKEVWSKNINNLNTQPDEIIIVSDTLLDTSTLKCKNIKNIVVPITDDFRPAGHYRNMAIQNSSSCWIVGSDIDDEPLTNFLDNFDDNYDICAFSYIDTDHDQLTIPDKNSLMNRRLRSDGNRTISPQSAIKKYVFDEIKFEDSGHEDLIFYSVLSLKNISITNVDPNIPRFIYRGYHKTKYTDENDRVSKIYLDVLNKKRNIYCFWFSENMTENRKNAFNVLQKTCGVNIVLINDDTFFKYEHNEIPIHKAFQYLSDVHKSAYARAYMMYFYGEGYSDIKANSFDWNEYFEQLFLSKYDAIGYPEKDPKDIAPFWENNVPYSVSNEFYRFAGNGHYIFKPKTKFAHEWVIRMHNILDKKFDTLQQNPGRYSAYAIPGGLHDSHKEDFDYSSSKYPIEWNEINGRIKQDIENRNNFTNFIVNMPYVNMNNYR